MNASTRTRGLAALAGVAAAALGLAATTMCSPPASSYGPAATNGGLTMTGTDLNKFSEVDIDDSAIYSRVAVKR